MRSIVYCGLDVHKSTISAALINPETGEFWEHKFQNDKKQLMKRIKEWEQHGELHVCYEASSAGFTVKRWLDEKSVHCDVVAPGLIPKEPGNRVKTDRRDARKLAKLLAANMLTPIRIPTKEEETVRAVVRLREDLTDDMTRAKTRVTSYLRLCGFVYTEGDTWTQKHRKWLTGLRLDATQATVLRTYLNNVDHLVNERAAIDLQIAEIANTEPYREGVNRLICLKGIRIHSAMVILAEIIDVRRFVRPTQVMCYSGLVPSESSSGDTRYLGSITKVGNAHLRRVLVEAAWNQIGKPGFSDRLKKQWATQPPEIVAIAKKAEIRLHKKYWKLAMRKDRRKAATAVARELAGFVWSILSVEAAA